MKNVLVIVLSVFLVFPAAGQLNFGVKAGLNTNSITMDDLKEVISGDVTYTIEEAKGAAFGFHGGVFLRLGTKKIFLQPELLFSTRTNEYTVTNIQEDLESLESQKFNKLDIPVMAGMKFGPVRINAGPSASLLINSPGDLIRHPEFKTMYSRMTFGYQAGLGLDLFDKLTFDIRYEGSLKKYQNQIENMLGTRIALDDRPNAFLFSLGIMF
ncbi:MAG: PorT family protein [Bacteroidales bacterium]|nr:PorT family protein [Bacteroidales bacterium]